MAGDFGPGIKALIDARNRRPSEKEAVGVIARYAVIPATLVGLLVGAIHVWDNPRAEIVWACGAGAFGGGFVAMPIVFGVYRVLGFKPLVRLVDGILGGTFGLIAGSIMIIVMRRLWPGLNPLWFAILCPLGVVIGPLLAPRPNPAE